MAYFPAHRIRVWPATLRSPLRVRPVSNVYDLKLGGNALSGEIPPELGNLSKLRELYLHENDLSGCVPGSLKDQLDFSNSDLGDLPLC